MARLKNPERSQQRRIEEEVRFWLLVEKTPTCWIWHGNITQQGYGSVTYQNGTYKAHMIPFLLKGLKVGGSRLLHHECENRRCIRDDPNHVVMINESEHNRRHQQMKEQKGKSWQTL